MTTISNLSLFMIVLVAGILLGAADEIYENRNIKSANGEKRPFLTGSRYGRSSQSDLTNMDTMTKSRIVPRSDRLFFTSRYGKRSIPLTAVDDDNNSIQCFYTGTTNLFRCVESSFEESNI